jgi:hypothetical protein
MRRLAALVAVLASWLACGAPARALSQFGSYGPHAGQFVEPFGIAVQDDTSDLFVLDTNNHRIERFTKDGVFVLAWGWGVADGRTPTLQTCKKRCLPGISGAGSGQLAFAEGIAIDNNPVSISHNDVYIVDISNHRVERFSPNGRFMTTFGGGVNMSARARHDIGEEGRCPVRPGDRCGAGAVGRGRGQFEFPVEGAALAVGPGGIVYVGDRNRVEEFDARGIYRSQIPLLPALEGATAEVGGVSGLTVDSHGDIYVIRNRVSGVREYAPDGRLLRVFDDKGEPAGPEGPTPAMTLDRSGDVFIDEYEHGRHQLVEYAADGLRLATFDGGNEDALHGLAYSDAAGRLYAVATNSNVRPLISLVRVLTPPPPAPLANLPFLPWLQDW